MKTEELPTDNHLFDPVFDLHLQAPSIPSSLSLRTYSFQSRDQLWPALQQRMVAKVDGVIGEVKFRLEVTSAVRSHVGSDQQDSSHCCRALRMARTPSVPMLFQLKFSRLRQSQRQEGRGSSDRMMRLDEMTLASSTAPSGPAKHKPEQGGEAREANQQHCWPTRAPPARRIFLFQHDFSCHLASS